ncbi:Ribonucleases P/MRP protein subunit POP1 containing protein [Tritrichomonas foetus]|uniref:Ribonucleases P/MRP protein subunit POP1 containing protein n=1 Tax=Tritrichomonas foetus TaxID=1144522 RepID=A0A1J4L268_9EUKA|nr:Ribonucleases P/MRP protein subunit POP1 containing protein [Tritrichomonas foetus]|eukprot:OHT16038.1 Ribonucleases P/MRP protein subunit POP1 containing protein [Tritrichomonas foetus]
MALTPVIKTVDFAKERDPSIDKMIQKMENTRPSHKRVFQKLPKHLRRRAMSYDIRKIPKSMQQNVEEQVAGAAEAKARNKPKGRDPNKYRQHGRNQIIHRNHEHRWLETHLWHAKRFHMRDMWGWKIPWAPTMKQTRNLIKMTKENCTMRDISYNVVISVKGENSLLEAKIAELVRTNARIEKQQRLLFPAELFRPMQYPTAPIGPVEMLWVSENNLWIICHPTLREHIIETINEPKNEKQTDGVNNDQESQSMFDVEVIDGELNIFEIYGPNSTNAIRTVLVPTENNPKELIDYIYNLPDPSAIIPGIILSYTAYDPRTIDEHKEQLATDKVVIDYSKINELYSNSPLFTDRAFEFKSEEDFNQERSKLLFPKSEGPSGSLPVLLMQQYAMNGFGSSWLLILPFGCGNTVFRKLVHRGVRTFGLECSRLIDLEASRFNFPYDRPDTNEGMQIMTKEMIEILTENEARPPGKRKNIQFYNLPDDYYISLQDNSESYVKVGILMAKRGTPSRFSTIYIPNPEDYQLVGQIAEIKGERRPIGFILNGNSSLLAGEGRGIGIIMAQAVLHFLPESESENNFVNQKRPVKNSFLVVIREQGSQYLHLGWAFVHSANYYP